MDTGNFSEQLKWVDVKAIYKKGSTTDKENYRPLNIPLNISKIFERFSSSQLNNYFDRFFSYFNVGLEKDLV